MRENTICTYDELDDAAKARAFSDWMEEREADPYRGQVFADTCEAEIWEAVRDLEKEIAAANVEWRYNPWYSCDFDCEYKIRDIDWIDPDEMEPAKDNGVWCSMDICDAWNAHIGRINAISHAVDHLYSLEDELEKNGYMELITVDRKRGHRPGSDTAYRIDKMIGIWRDRWIQELEAACDDVRDAIETALRSEWDWYTSEEAAREEFGDELTQGGEAWTRDRSGRVIYSDSRRWYTLDGEFIKQRSTRECVSIVKAA